MLLFRKEEQSINCKIRTDLNPLLEPKYEIFVVRRRAYLIFAILNTRVHAPEYFIQVGYEVLS